MTIKMKQPKRADHESHLWVKDIKEDSHIRGLYLAKVKRVGLTRKGDPFLSITLADRSGEIVCVSNFPTAMIDLPVESSSENARLGFEAATENIPAKGTPVRVILIPHALEKEKSSDE